MEATITGGADLYYTPDGSSITEVANAAFADNGYSQWNSLVQVDHDTTRNAIIPITPAEAQAITAFWRPLPFQRTGLPSPPWQI